MCKTVHELKKRLLYRMNFVMMLSIVLCSLFIVFLNYSVCHSTDLSEEAEILLELEGIENATSDVKRFAKKVVKMKIDHEKKLSVKDKELGAMKFEKDNCARPLLILATRSKIKDHVRKNYPMAINNKTGETIYGKPDRLSFCDAISEMISSKAERFTNDPYIMQFRGRLEKYKISERSFMKFIRWLYNQFSDADAHVMARYAPSLPEYNDVKAISDMLKCVEMDRDAPAIASIQIILEPFHLPSREDPDDSFPFGKILNSMESLG